VSAPPRSPTEPYPATWVERSTNVPITELWLAPTIRSPFQAIYVQGRGGLRREIHRALRTYAGHAAGAAAAFVDLGSR
jgi:hypothetical protein